jgi:hypothetical protein
VGLTPTGKRRLSTAHALHVASAAYRFSHDEGDSGHGSNIVKTRLIKTAKLLRPYRPAALADEVIE